MRDARTVGAGRAWLRRRAAETERTGNCPLFAKLVKQTLDEHGVQFRFGAEVAAIRVDTGRAAVELVPPGDRRASNAREVDVISADAIVVAAGAGSLPLLDRLGWRLPLHPVRVHTLTAPVAYEEHAPHLNVIDSIKRISITRTPAAAARRRRRGAAEPARDREAARRAAEAALALLAGTVHDCARRRAHLGRVVVARHAVAVAGRPAGRRSDPHPRVLVNFGHGPAGWGPPAGLLKW